MDVYHSVAWPCLHRCKSNQLSLRSNADLGMSEHQTPEPINVKFGVGDYVGDMTPHAKIHNSRPSGGVLAYAWNITLAWFV